jgi:hypothetical protein
VLLVCGALVVSALGPAKANADSYDAPIVALMVVQSASTTAPSRTSPNRLREYLITALRGTAIVDRYRPGS